MLEGVGAVAVRGGGGGARPHAPDRLDGTRSRLERERSRVNVKAFDSFTSNLRRNDNSK